MKIVMRRVQNINEVNGNNYHFKRYIRVTLNETSLNCNNTKKFKVLSVSSVKILYFGINLNHSMNKLFCHLIISFKFNLKLVFGVSTKQNPQ